MSKVLAVIQIVISCLLIAAIIIQNKGVGLSQTFGGGGEGNAFSVRRGAEKILFIITVVLSATFLGLAVSHLFIWVSHSIKLFDHVFY